MGFATIALPLAAKNVPVMPLKPRDKIAFLGGWQNLATTDAGQIASWDKLYPDANCGCVAKAREDGFFFFEVDRPEAVQRLEEETGRRIPRTFRVRSSPGRGHFYFKQTGASIKMGNVSQGNVRFKDFSVRVDNEYVVSPNSIHPGTGLPYEILTDTDIIPAPDWLIDWILAQKLDQKKFSDDIYSDEPLPAGCRNVGLTSIAGRLRNTGMGLEELSSMMLGINQRRGIPPLDDAEVRAIVRSICKYPIPADNTLIIGGVRAGTAKVEFTPEERKEFKLITYPEFPTWVMHGTSLHKGLVQPVLETSSKYPEMVYMPAVQLLLNSVAGRVRLRTRSIIPNIFLGLIAPKGRFFKSSCCELAQSYFQMMGLAQVCTASTKNAEGKVQIVSAGSPEGLGTIMTRVNGKNALLYYDELGKFINKAGIENSSFSNDLLTFYESGFFANGIKSRKETYAFDAGSYCFSWLWCTTDLNFMHHWAKLGAVSSGLDDRMFFLMSPKDPKEAGMFQDPPIQDGALETRKIVDQAIEAALFQWEDYPSVERAVKGLDARQMGMVERLALYFAIDLGLPGIIDDDCVERALKLVQYQKSVKKYLIPFEAVTKEAGVQMEIINYLRKNNGQASFRDLNKNLHPEKYGTTMWGGLYVGLIRNKYIREEGTGAPGDEKNVVLLQAPEIED